MTQEPGNPTTGAVPGREPAASEIAYQALIGEQPPVPATGTYTGTHTGADTGATAAGAGSDDLTSTSASGRAGAAKDEAQHQAADVAGHAREQAADVAGHAREQAADVAGHAREQAADVAGHAKEQAAAVAGTAKEQAGNVLGEARAQAGDLLEDLRRQLAEQSDGIRDRLAEFLTTAGSELSDMAGAGGGSGYATTVVRQAGDRASSWGAHLSRYDAPDLLEQGRSFARRKPGTFLLGAVVAGVLAGRLTRGAKAHHDRTSPSTGSPAAPLGGRHASEPTTDEVLPYSESEAILARTDPGTSPATAPGAAPGTAPSTLPVSDPFASPDPRP